MKAQGEDVRVVRIDVRSPDLAPPQRFEVEHARRDPILLVLLPHLDLAHQRPFVLVRITHLVRPSLEPAGGDNDFDDASYSVPQDLAVHERSGVDERVVDDSTEVRPGVCTRDSLQDRFAPHADEGKSDLGLALLRDGEGRRLGSFGAAVGEPAFVQG